MSHDGGDVAQQSPLGQVLLVQLHIVPVFVHRNVLRSKKQSRKLTPGGRNLALHSKSKLQKSSARVRTSHWTKQLSYICLNTETQSFTRRRICSAAQKPHARHQQTSRLSLHLWFREQNELPFQCKQKETSRTLLCLALWCSSLINGLHSIAPPPQKTLEGFFCLSTPPRWSVVLSLVVWVSQACTQPSLCPW